MNSKKDYTGYASLIAILVIVFLAAASRIPGTKIGEVKLKKINILSDLIEDDAPSTSREISILIRLFWQRPSDRSGYGLTYSGKPYGG